jgi:hypothetical protein
MPNLQIKRAKEDGNPSLALKNLSLQINKKELIMTELLSKVNEINNLHQLAMSAAKDAVTYAKKIGTLLLESKSEIPHGKFIKWIEENTSISPRQAQRYMRVASGKDLKISDFSNKNDKMSYLSSDEYLDRITMNPVWVPPAGHWFKCIHENALFALVPDKLHPEDFHITKFQLLEGSTLDDLEIDLDKELHWTKQPVMASKVEGMLHVFGLDYPETKDWWWVKRMGMDEPLGIADTSTASGEKIKNV